MLLPISVSVSLSVQAMVSPSFSGWWFLWRTLASILALTSVSLSRWFFRIFTPLPFLWLHSLCSYKNSLLTQFAGLIWINTMNTQTQEYAARGLTTQTSLLWMWNNCLQCFQTEEIGCVSMNLRFPDKPSASSFFRWIATFLSISSEFFIPCSSRDSRYSIKATSMRLSFCLQQ